MALPNKTTSVSQRRIDKSKPTAVFLVKGIGAALHTILWVERMFPKHFHNYVFVSYGWVDTGSFGSDIALERLQKHVDKTVEYLTHFSQSHGIATTSIKEYGANPIEAVSEIAASINQDYDNAVFFASRYVYREDLLINRYLHSDFSMMVQRQLQNIGTKILIVPLKLDT